MQLLFDNFELFSEAPNGIQKLRKLILNLAVRGKLVAQNLSEEAVSGHLSILNKEKPFDIPRNWVWCRITDLYSSIGLSGKKIKAKFYNEKGQYPIVDQGRKFIAGYTNEENALIRINNSVVVFGDHTKVIKYVDFDFVAGADGTKILNPNEGVFTKYFYWVLNSYDLADRGYSRHYKILKQQVFPLPPYEEQKCIVAKVDQLMALCDELEKHKEKRDQKRISLNNAALNKLVSAKQANEFQQHWQRIADNFDLLYEVPENVKQLKQAILQLGVQGKLVPHDPNDEPASELLKRIKAEKQKLFKEGKIKKEKPLPPISEDEIPYELPKGWEWCRMQEAIDVRDGTHDTPQYVQKGIPFVTSKNLKSGSIDFSNVNCISNEDHLKFSKRSCVTSGDILFAMIGSIGNAVIVKEKDGDFSIKNVALFKFFGQNHVETQYLKIYLDQISLIMNQQAAGGVQKFVSLKFLRNYLLALPPLSEQKRIVSKVDILMKLCDELETQLEQSKKDSEKLMEAVLQEAFSGNSKQ